jgi:capsular exopolysaccharide synthesis family protein
MSRIHEALKKAEQERALSQPTEAVESSAVFVEPQGNVETVMANAAVRAGALPTLTAENAYARIRQTNWRPDPQTMLFFNSEEHASGMEEFRTLRSRLYQARERQPLSKLLITSPLPKEGKSFTTANLAQVLVRQHGRRALMIDADLRNPQLHQLLGAESGPGLAEYLRGELDEFSIIQRGPMENLFLMPAGGNTGNPAELVANGRMRFLLNRLDPLFDWIVIDSPPAALVSDANQLANYCDGVILVVRSNKTPVDAARRARKEFADRNVLGVVLNGIAPELSPYAQYYYSAYAGGSQGQANN